MTFAIGCWGVGNVGDDAVLQGQRLVMGEIRGDWQSAGKGDTLVLGGGGIFHSSPRTRSLLNMARRAREHGTQVEIRACGTETCPPSGHKALLQLMGLCRRVTLRSKASVKWACGQGVFAEYEPDFAFQLPRPAAQERQGLLLVPTTDTTLTGQALTAEILSQSIQTCLDAGHERVVVASHVPRHRLAERLSEEPVFQAAVDLTDDAKVCYTGLWSPSHALEVYASVEQAVVWRYHGLVFGWLAGTPTVPGVQHPKLLEFDPPENA